MPDQCQTNVSFLKGGDRVLYDVLTSGGDSSAYDVQVVAATIYRTSDYDNRDENTTRCALFSPAIVKRTLGIKSDSDSDTEEEEEVTGGEAQLKRQKVEKEDTAAASERTKLVLPNDLASDSLLDYTPYIEHTGNESQTGHSVYIVAGLQVRRRV